MKVTPFKLNSLSKFWILAGAIFITAAAMPNIALAQEQEQQVEPMVPSQEVTNPTYTPGNSNGPWGNSGGAVSNSNADNTDPGNAINNDPVVGAPVPVSGTNPRGGVPGRGGIRRNGTNGITTEGRDPAGNPDVPFDDTMNFAFLLFGLVFALFVYRKQLILKLVEIKK